MYNTLRRFLKFVFISSATIPFIFASATYAQTIPDSLRGELEPVVIEATYSPISIDAAPMSLSYRLRNAEEMAARPAVTMDDLTFTIPGVTISNRENYALGERMSIRGLGWRSPFGVRGVQVLLDDLPLTVADGQTIMSMIDPAMVRKIELLRGPSATFWGNSSGGVLHLSTVPQRNAPLLQYRGYGGSFGTLKQELQWNYANERSRIYGYTTYFETEGYRNYSAAQLFRSSIGLEHSVSDNGRLTLNANYTSMPKAQHPGALTESQLENDPKNARDNFRNSNAGKNFDQAMLGLSYLHTFSTGVLEVTTHGTYRDVENPLPFGFIGVERYAGGGRGIFSFKSLPFRLDAGAEFKIQSDDRLETNNINGERGDQISVEQTESVVNSAIFMRTGIPVSDALTLSGGLRADWITFEAEDGLGNNLEGERDFFSINPSLGLNYTFNNSQIFANFSTSFESPTTTELVNRPGGGNGFNQNVDPESTISFESGVRGTLPALNARYDVTAYRMLVKDLLVSFQTEESGPTFFRNEGTSDHYGIETSFQFTTHPIYSLELMANVMRAVFNGGDLDGNDLPGVPSFQSGAILSLNPGTQRFTLEARHTGRYPADSQNSALTDSYVVTNLRWTTKSIPLGGNTALRPFVNVGNIFDVTYATSVNINAFGGFYYEPGASRSLQAGLQFNFN
ncbi:TonB-dependent receptor family protein [Rhodohalobacter sp. 8-1]|uniref:TonB-dependent receptor family protein n=1 Tax=Rhodohalobacter sp. 8-1 TaxID=3131972 RepID=UPI0030EE5626